jgi:hypothetical protein
VGREARAQLGEPRQVAVVRERERNAGELERMDVLQRNLDLRAVRDSAHVREHASRAHLAARLLRFRSNTGSESEAYANGVAASCDPWVPRAHAEARKV